MNIINFKKTGPILAFSIYGYLIAVGTVNKNLFLLLFIVLPVLTLGVIALVLTKPKSYNISIRSVGLPSRVRKKTIYHYSLMLIMGICSLNFIAPANPTFIERGLASIILIIGFIPTFLYVKHNDSDIPYLPLFGAIFSIYYGLPIFLLEYYSVGSHTPPYASIEKALLLAIIGLFMLYMAYYSVIGKLICKHLPQISLRWDDQKAKFWAILFIVIGLGSDYLFLSVNIPVRFQQIMLFLTKLSLIGIGILFILQLQGQLNYAGKVFLWCFAIPSLLMLKLGIGAIAQILIIIIFLSLVYWTIRKKLPWKAAVFAVLLLIILISTRADFRSLTWGGGLYSEKNPIEKSRLFAQMALSYDIPLLSGYKIAVTRVAHIMSFAHVVDQTPENIPYLNGQTYNTLLWTPIPRIIYPDKPTKELGQVFGHRYSFLHPDDESTSFNFPQLVEMYANFGITGIIFGMFIVGIIYRSISEMFSHSKAGEGGLLIGCFLFTGLSNIESDFSLVFGGLLYQTLLLILVNIIIKKRQPKEL